MFGMGVGEVLVLAVVALVIWPFWKIFSKAGFSGAWSLTQFVPILNIVVLFYVAFSEWPVHRELDALKRSRPPAAA